jgi:hypothetical protein
VACCPLWQALEQICCGRWPLLLQQALFSRLIWLPQKDYCGV